MDRISTRTRFGFLVAVSARYPIMSLRSRVGVGGGIILNVFADLLIAVKCMSSTTVKWREEIR